MPSVRRRDRPQAWAISVIRSIVDGGDAGTQPARASTIRSAAKAPSIAATWRRMVAVRAASPDGRRSSTASRMSTNSSSVRASRLTMFGSGIS